MRYPKVFPSGVNDVGQFLGDVYAQYPQIMAKRGEIR
jgi:hypothetical protein